MQVMIKPASPLEIKLNTTTHEIFNWSVEDIQNLIKRLIHQSERQTDKDIKDAFYEVARTEIAKEELDAAVAPSTAPFLNDVQCVQFNEYAAVFTVTHTPTPPTKEELDDPEYEKLPQLWDVIFVVNLDTTTDLPDNVVHMGQHSINLN